MLERSDGERKLFTPYLQCGCLSGHGRVPTASDVIKAKKIADLPSYHSSYYHQLDKLTKEKVSPFSAFHPTDHYKNNHLNLKLEPRESSSLFLEKMAGKSKMLAYNPKCTSKLTSVNENFISQPIQIFNHIQPQVFPFPVSALSSKYRCCDFWNPFSLFPHPHRGHQQFDSKWGRKQIPGSVDENIILHKETTTNKNVQSPMNPTLSIPLPSESDGEPLDLLPKSFFANKSKKGHLCIYCGKLYSRKYGLKIHLRTHTGYKPLKCKVCMRPFGDPSNLNKHIRLHAEGDTPYRCDFCGKVLVRRRDLERHLKSRHPNEILVNTPNNLNSESQKEIQSEDIDVNVDDSEQEVIVV